MKYSILYVIFIMMMIMSEKIFIVGVFLFGYSLGYYFFEINYKNKKD